MLTRLWASVYAAGNAILDDYKKYKVQGSQIRIGYGGGKGKVTPKEVERRINSGELSIVPLKGEDGQRVFAHDKQALFTFKYPAIELTGYEIIKVPKNLVVRPGNEDFQGLHNVHGGREVFCVRESTHAPLTHSPSFHFFETAENAVAAAKAAKGQDASCAQAASATSATPPRTSSSSKTEDPSFQKQGVLQKAQACPAPRSSTASAVPSREINQMMSLLDTLVSGQHKMANQIAQVRSAQSHFSEDITEKMRKHNETVVELSKNFNALSAWVIGDVIDKLQA